MQSLGELLQSGVVIGDGGYLIELERRGYVDSGSGREKVGTGRGSGQFTPEAAVENPEALRELHREFLCAGSKVLQALTFFGTREKLNRAGYGAGSALCTGAREVDYTRFCYHTFDPGCSASQAYRGTVRIEVPSGPTQFTSSPPRAEV